MRGVFRITTRAKENLKPGAIRLNTPLRCEVLVKYWPELTVANLQSFTQLSSMEKLSGKELLLRYSNGIRDFSKLELKGISLFEKVLRDVDFSGSDLRNAYLPYSQLNESTFYRADLAGADLADVQLYRANFAGANLSQVNLQRANLRHADLRGANLTQATLHCADLREANLDGANLTGAIVTSVEANGASFAGAIVTRCTFFRSTGINLDDCQWDGAIIQPDGYRGKPLAP